MPHKSSDDDDDDDDDICQSTLSQTEKHQSNHQKADRQAGS
jgi:hypothetical protein